MQVKRFVGMGLAIAALVVGLAGCGGDDDDQRLTGSQPEVVAKSDPKPHFEPKELTARLGTEVAFDLKNEGDKVHNFTLSFLGVDQDVQPGETVQIRFTVTEPPKGVDFFTFYDKNHQGEGMQGRINVEK